MSDNLTNGGIDDVATAVAGLELSDATEPETVNSPADSPTDATTASATGDSPADSASDGTASATASPGLAPEQDTKFEEYHRLESFPLVWPDSNSFKKPELAREGIYFDTARCGYYCAFCDVQFDVSGQADESIRCRHQRLSPECPVVTNTATNNRPLEPLNNFRLERHRRISFLRTNWEAPVDPRDLAKWGFYWTGLADMARCKFCGLEVRGWEPGDSGETDHKRWSPNCPFLMGRAVGNVELGAEQAAGEVLGAEYASGLVAHGEAGVQYMGNQGPLSAHALGLTLTATARHPEYATFAARLQTYTFWPSVLARPELMAEAGFYYTGKGDRALCFHCGGGLKDWGVGDQPWVEHAVAFKDCAFLNVFKGREFVAQTQASRAQQHQQQGAEEEEPREGGNPAEEEPNAQGQAAAALAPSAQEPGAVEEQRVCRICLESEICIVFLPCGHMSACATCAPQLSTCPICRAQTRAFVRAFLP